MLKLAEITGFLKTVGVIVALTFLLFILINIFSSIYLEANPIIKKSGNHFLGKNSYTGVEIRKKIFDTNDEVLLAEYSDSPGIRPHPVLHFTEGRSRPHYKVGIEGVRYLSAWTDETVKGLLAEKNTTYVFGGSTTFGDGVPNDATVVAYLNYLDKDGRYVNFGVQAYDSIREVDKLIYLLRKGYRPKTIIFIDGLNDIATFARSPYEIHDTPRAQGLVLDRGQIPLIFGVPKSENMLLAIAYGFPVTHLIYRLMNKKHAGDAFIRKSANEHGLDDWLELMYFHYNWSEIHANRIEDLANDIIRYYRKNIDFVTQLGESFGFDAHFIYQPIGLLEEGQQFLKKSFFESDRFSLYKGVDSKIRMEIEFGGLKLKDCSRSIAESGVQGMYVDATHYSPEGNSVLANCIHKEVSL